MGKLVDLNLLKKISTLNTAAQRFGIMLAALPISYTVDTYFSGAKDEKTKANARIKNIAKALACGLVGVAVRALALFSIDKLTQFQEIKTDGFFVKTATKKPFWGCLLPNLSKRVSGITKAELLAKRAKYASVGANLLAAVVMIFTNVLCDAPLTKFFTNYGIKKFGYPNEKGGFNA